MPWGNEEYSGKMKYTLKNGENYEIYRDFKKKKPLIYNSFGEDVSKDYGTTKKEINFFEEQSGMDENSFFSTAIVQQQAVKLGKTDTHEIVQKISNLVSTGDDNISYKKSLEKINKLQNENIGTDRTKNKPINIVNSKISYLENEKKNLMHFKDSINNHNNDKEKLNLKLEQYYNQKLYLKDLKQILEDNKLKNVELDYERKIKQEQEQKVNEIKEKIKEKKENQEISKSERLKRNIAFGLMFVFLAISIIMYISAKNIMLGFIFDLLAIFSLAFLIKLKKDVANHFKQLNQKLSTEYDIALKNYNKCKTELAENEKKIENVLKENKKKVIEKYKNKVDNKYLENKLDVNLDRLGYELDLIDDSINELKIEIQMLDSKKEDIDEKLDKLAKIENELFEQIDVKNDLESLDISYNLAKECLEKAYDEIKHNISPKFEQKLCEIISYITNEKYKKVSVDDEEGIHVELENGSIVSVDKLSSGTIDEMYLALRLSILDEISNENMPIMLDETFAYFDDNRLKNILYYLQDKNYENQIILFTCTNREEDILNELKIEYNLVKL